MARPDIDETAQGYNITIIGRNVEVTEPMKQYAQDKVGKIERLHGKVLEVVVTMDIIKLEHRVDIVMKVDHTKIAVHASSESMYASVDKATDRLQRKLRRYRSRLQEHHARGLSAVDMNVNLIPVQMMDEVEDINDAIETENQDRAEELLRPHEITQRKTIKLKTLTHHDAVMSLDLSNDHFLVFREEASKKVRVIYRRDREEGYGIIEPE